MVIMYQTAKFKSANTFEMSIWDPTTKFNSYQYFLVLEVTEDLHPCVDVRVHCAGIHTYFLGFLFKSDPSCIIKLVCNNGSGLSTLLRSG